MRRDLVFPAAFNAAVRRSLNDGTYNPAATNIGSAATASGGLLQLTGQWIPITFTDVIVTDLTRSDYCVVLNSGSSNSVWAEQYFASGAPANGMLARWSSNSGGSWSPASKDLNKQDFRFYIYATYFTPTTTDSTVTQQFMTLARVKLQRDADVATRVETSVQTLNRPEVTGL